MSARKPVISGAKTIDHNAIVRRLLAEVGGRVMAVRITGDISNQVIDLSSENPPNELVEKVTVPGFEEFEKQLKRWDTQEHAKFTRQADELFRQISTRLGADVAKEIFKTAAAKRVRGSEYPRSLNRALMVHALKFGVTNTARHAIDFGLGLPEEEENLIKHVQRLLKKGRSPKRDI